MNYSGKFLYNLAVVILVQFKIFSIRIYLRFEPGVLVEFKLFREKKKKKKKEKENKDMFSRLMNGEILIIWATTLKIISSIADMDQ